MNMTIAGLTLARLLGPQAFLAAAPVPACCSSAYRTWATHRRLLQPQLGPPASSRPGFAVVVPILS